MIERGVTLLLATLSLAAAAPAMAAPTVIDPAPTAAAPRAAPDDPTPAPTATPEPPRSPSNGAYADPLSDLGAGSPSCAGRVTGEARRNCERTGSVAHAYPISAYGFDVQTGFSITDLGDSFLGALQSIAALAWMALVYLVKGVLLLLEWAFSLDLLGGAMTDVRNTLNVLHENVIGRAWFLTSLSVAALWAMWRGLVQGRTSQTITGLGATVGLMVAGLVILANPTGTVGHASRLANDASLGLLAATSGRPLGDPKTSLSDTMSGLFDQIVRDPWCALQFGSVDYCDADAKGTTTVSNAQVWLEYPAQSKQRKGLYRLLKGEDPEGGHRPGVVDALAGPLGGAALDAVGIGDSEDPGLPEEVRNRVAKEPKRAAMQEAGGTFPRFALLALIAVGMTGAIALLAYIGIRLLLASLLALLLLLFTPAVLLAPAFGESGRATFIAWAKRLLGALVAKLVYALFLALVLAAGATLAKLDIGWFGIWLVQIAFWWGVLLKREELLGFATAGQSRQLSSEGKGSVLSNAYHAAQIGWMGSRVARTAVAPAGRALHAGRLAANERRTARGSAVRGLASEALDAQGERAIKASQGSAARTLAERGQLHRELRVIDRKLTAFDENHATARAEGIPAPSPDRDQEALLHRRKEILSRLDDAEVRGADQVARRASLQQAQTGSSVSPRDLAEHREARQRDLAADLPLDDPRHLRAAGIDPGQYSAAGPGEQHLLRETVREHLGRERSLVAATEGEKTITFDPAAVRRRSAEERARLRAERRERQVRPRR